MIRLQGDVGRDFFPRSKLEHADMFDAVLDKQCPEPAFPEDGVRLHGHDVQQLIHLRLGQPRQHKQLPDAEGVELQGEAVNRLAAFERAAFEDQTVAMRFQDKGAIALVEGGNRAEKDSDRLGTERVSGAVEAPGLYRRVQAADDVSGGLRSARNGHIQ